MQERAFVGVAAAGLWRYCVHQRHTARAGYDALGGRTADYLTVLHNVPHFTVWTPTIHTTKFDATLEMQKILW
jgi:hypothetical protein